MRMNMMMMVGMVEECEVCYDGDDDDAIRECKQAEDVEKLGEPLHLPKSCL